MPRFYEFIFAQVQCHVAIKGLWKSKCLPKLKVFLWLMYYDRLNTKDIMCRKQWILDDGPNCNLCNRGEPETRDHLLFDCPFASSCWRHIGIHWDMDTPIHQRVLNAQGAYQGPCFLEMFACATWNIWKTRNDYIFQQIESSFGRWKVKFMADLYLHRYRIKESLVQPLLLWLRTPLS